MASLLAQLRGYAPLETPRQHPAAVARLSLGVLETQPSGELAGSAHPSVFSKVSSVCGNKKQLRNLVALVMGATLVLVTFMWHSSVATVYGKETILLGGSPGFEYLENVWYKYKTFYLFSSTPAGLPNETMTVTGVGMRIEPQSRREDDHATPSVFFHGTSMFMDEGADSQYNGLGHFYHFAAEALLGGLASMATWAGEKSFVPDRLIFPWAHNWRDWDGLNPMVANGIFGDNIIEAEEWKNLSEGNGWVYFERIVIVDRWAAHRNTPLVETWNKMGAGIFTTPKQPRFFEHARHRLLDTFSIPDREPGSRQQLVYVDRQSSSRKLPEETQAVLLTQLEEFAQRANIEFKHAVFEGVPPKEQVLAVSQATIMLGIHGNGLTHELWMPSGGTVVELFPLNTFLRDYLLPAEVLGHTHIAIRNNTIFTKEQYASIGQEGQEHTHDGTPVLLDVPFLISVLEGVVRT